MKRYWPILLVSLAFFRQHLLAQDETPITSPDNRIVFILTNANGVPSFSIKYKGQTLIERSEIKLDIEGWEMIPNNFVIKFLSSKKVNETYQLAVGKASKIKNNYHQAIFSLSSNQKKEYRYDMEIRVFNDGVAFRYLIPKQPGQPSFILREEHTEFRFTTEPVVKALLLPNFTTSHEGLYTTSRLAEIKEDTLMDVPALSQLPGQTFVAITESALLDYAGMYLVKKRGVLCSQLSPLPGESAIKVKATLPHKSPWRVLLIGDKPGTLIESNIITSLNAPSAIKDLSWLKPGTTTFPWW